MTILDGLKECLDRLKDHHPCPHDSADYNLGNGRVWAKCDDCGQTFAQEDAQRFRSESDEFDDFVDKMELLIKGPPMEVKQVIVMRKDLKMRRGKEIAQGSHASISFLTRKLQSGSSEFTEVENTWINGGFTKICLQVDSERELMEIASKARKAGLECHVITDAGKTEFNGVPTKTCLAIGPDSIDKIDEVTGELSLY